MVLYFIKLSVCTGLDEVLPKAVFKPGCNSFDKLFTVFYIIEFQTCKYLSFDSNGIVKFKREPGLNNTTFGVANHCGLPDQQNISFHFDDTAVAASAPQHPDIITAKLVSSLVSTVPAFGYLRGFKYKFAIAVKHTEIIC